jgi:hypothetical protein
MRPAPGRRACAKVPQLSGLLAIAQVSLEL